MQFRSLKPPVHVGDVDFGYIQYLPKDMGGKRNVNIDKAIRDLYAPRQKDIYELCEAKPPKKRGFEEIFLKKRIDKGDLNQEL